MPAKFSYPNPVIYRYLWLGLLLLSLNSFARHKASITIHFTDTSLETVLDYLDKTYELEFSYSRNHLSVDQKITIHLENKSLEETLHLLFDEHGIRYRQIGNRIALKQGEVYYASTKKTTQQPVKVKQPDIIKEEVDQIKSQGNQQTMTPPPNPGANTPVKSLSGKNRYVNAKIYTRRTFQASLVPGLGTNGIDPGAYKNNFSINVISGYSASTRGIEIGGFSNFNTLEAKGLQLAGIANVVGGNGLLRLTPKEIKQIRKEGYQFNMDGIQVAGMANIVRGNMTGFQATIGENLVYNSFTGWQTGVGLNVVHEYSTGFQLAGLGNVTGRSISGLQLAGLTNFSVQQVKGIQVSALFNFTKGRLNGTQVGAVNFSGNVQGRFSKLSTKYSGLQIGLFNKVSRNMDGFQIGLINYGGDMNGLQVGLVNISSRKQRYPVGLININNDLHGYLRTYVSELFMYNFEFASGSKHMINTISYHLNPAGQVDKNQPHSAIGYAIGKQVTRKMFYYNGDLQFQHVNYQKGFAKELSLLTKLRGVVGFEPLYHTKLRDLFIFGGITFNSYVSNRETPLSDEGFRIHYKQDEKNSWETWVGYMVGIHVDFH